MKLVLAHGVFDLLHPDHCRHLEEARSFGDALIVSVVPDAFVQKGRPPLNSQLDRLFLLQALCMVDGAMLCGGPGPEKLLKLLRPAIYVRGSEYVSQDKPEYALCKELGIEVGFTRPLEIHTSAIIKRIRELA